MPELDILLHKGDPAARLTGSEIDRRVGMAEADALVRRSAASRTPRWKRARVVIPVLVVTVALMGAAVVTPLRLWIDGREADLDLKLPVEYTTTSGQEIHCTIGASLGSTNGRGPELDAVADELRDRDWSGLGEEIYEYSVTHPFSPAEDYVMESDTPKIRQRIAFQLAITAVLTLRTADVMPAGAGFAITGDCPGPDD